MRGAALWVLSVLSVLPWRPSAGAELAVPNGSFEQAADQGALHWHWWSRTKSGSVVRTAEDHHALGHSVRLEHDGERDWAFSNDHRFPAKPGQAYLATAWARVKRGHVVLAVVALQGGRTLSWDIGSASVGARDKWGKVEAVAEVPDGCDQVYVRFVGDGDTLAWVDDVGLRPTEPPKPVEKPKVQGYAAERVRERLGRGLVAMPLAGRKVYLGWRLLDTDPENIAFDLYRRRGKAPAEKLNAQPIAKTTDFLDASPAPAAERVYVLRQAGRDEELGKVAVTTAESSPGCVSIRLQGKYSFQKVGLADLDGDGRYDFVIKQPNVNIDPWYKYWKRSEATYQLEAYNADGKFLWRHDLGWAIETGIWYSPYVVYDLDGDGRAEVAVKTGEGDPRGPDGKVQSGPEHLTILDGLTGKPRARVDWPSREPFAKQGHGYNYASRNQLGIAYLDGKTPCLLVERGTYNLILVVAYEFHGGTLRELWRWDNRREPRRYWGQGAHWMHAADVDADGRDEVLIGSCAIDDNGVSLWSTGLGHPDHFYVGDIDPARPGLEIYYGIETRQPKANGMCLVDAKTGKILWGHQGSTRHVHGHGLCSDIDGRHPGSECFSTDTDASKRAAWARLRTARGEVISEDMTWGFGPLAVHWDADAQREVLWKGRILDYGGQPHPTRVQGHVAAVADILGDWREEIVTSVPGELRIYTTPLPAADRRPCLMQDPIYRIDVAHAAMGYFQVPLLSYDVATRKP